MQLRRTQVCAIAVALRLASLPRNGALTLKEISEPLPDRHAHVVRAVRQLTHAGIVEPDYSDAVRYRLARTINRITLLDLLEAAEGRFAYIPPPSFAGLSLETGQTIESAIALSVDALRKQLAAVTLADLRAAKAA